MLNMFLVNEQTHTLLTLIGDNLFTGEGLVTNRQFRHVNLTTTFLYQLGETVQVTGTTVVVDRYNRVGVFLAEGTDEVIGTLLHLWVGTLDSVQLNTITVTASIYRGDTTATKSDAIVVTTNHYDLITLLGLFLQTVTLSTVAHAASKHNHFVVSVLGRVRGCVTATCGLLVLKGQH